MRSRHPVKKTKWMRLNPLVCIEADEMETLQKWCSVVAFGRYVELPKAVESERERHHAHALLWEGSSAWEPGYARTILHGKHEELEPLYFRIDVTEISGRRARSSETPTDVC
jgi:nitroimidazol reductase NimA-like FMN-containing flavoprotein (pyridoxamine 5'-phosphate oxidase superfamily)